MKTVNNTKGSSVVLKMTIGQEHELLSAQKIDDPDSLMYPAYQQAVRALHEIVESAARWQANQEKIGSLPKGRSNLYGYANNTIAFCGSRGQGKTSAMLSFGNVLAGRTGTGKIRRELDPACVITENRFYVMDPIDPTMLKRGGHVSEIVLSYLYTQMKQLLSQGDCAGMPMQKKENLLRLFQQAFSWLHPTEHFSDGQDDFYDYEKLGHGFDIKENLYQLIEEFLMLKAGIYRGDGLSPISACHERHFLVILLDDMDLQLQNSYSMLEEVRQYLQLPNTIILMAADIDQLRKMTNMHYCQEMKSALENELMSADEFRRLAAKYLDKLIPASQMVYLPEYRLSFRSGDDILVQIIEEKKPAKNEQELHENLFGLIYRKTGLVFVKHESYLNNLIPTTLRGLRQLYRLLNTLPDPCEPSPLPTSLLSFSRTEFEDSAEKERKTVKANEVMRAYLTQRLERVRQLEQNLAVFQSYFVGDWCASKLDEDSEKVLRAIRHSAKPSNFSTALEELKKWYKDYFDDYASISSSFAEKAPSYSTLCEILNAYTKKGTAKAYLLAFSIRTHFSIQFTADALLEQRHQIEALLENFARFDGMEIFRFRISYNNLKARFEKNLLDADTLKSILVGNILPRPRTAAEILKGYIDLLCPGNSNLPNNSDPAQIWQYWTAQDWAAELCCNWELQDCVLKYMDSRPPKCETLSEKNDYINNLNDYLLQKHPLCKQISDFQKKIIVDNFASFIPKEEVPSLVVPLDENRASSINSALELITSANKAVKFSLNTVDGNAKSALKDASTRLFVASNLLRGYLCSDLIQELEEMSSKLSASNGIDIDTCHQLNTLNARIRREVRSLR